MCQALQYLANSKAYTQVMSTLRRENLKSNYVVNQLKGHFTGYAAKIYRVVYILNILRLTALHLKIY
jgi:hypothetical protein